MKNNNSGRSFIAALALGSSASVFSMLLKDYEESEDFILEASASVEEAKSWIAKIKGSHRIVYDDSKSNNAFSLIWNWAYYQSNNDGSI